MKPCLLLTVALLLPQAVLAQPATLESFVATYAKEHNFNGSILVQEDSSTTTMPTTSCSGRSSSACTASPTRRSSGTRSCGP